MLCKFYLHLNSYVVMVGDDDCYDVSNDVTNWQQLKQSYTRKNLGGVVKNYGSKIEFTGKAYELLVELWRSQYVHARAAFAIHVIDNSWEYHEAWQCPLDFATLTYDGHKVSVNCTEVSAASLIKSNGGTKSSYSVSALRSEYRLLYDRVMSYNEVQYVLTGETETEGDTFTKWHREMNDPVGYESNLNFPLSNLGGTIAPNNVLAPQSQDAYVNYGWASPKYMAEASGSCLVHVDFSAMEFWVWHYGQYDMPAITIMLYKYHVENHSHVYKTVLLQKTFNVEDGEHFTLGSSFVGDFEMEAGERLVFCMWPSGASGMASIATVYMSNDHAIMSWASRGEPVDVDVIEPSTLLHRILRMVADGKAYIDGEISSTIGGVTNTRLTGTKMLAAESMRGFDDAQIHTSFNQFASFMEAVFGYVYRIDRLVRDRVDFDSIIEYSAVEGKLIDGYSGTVVDSIHFVRNKGMFVGRLESDDKYSRLFVDYDDYMRILEMARDDGSWTEVLELPVFVDEDGVAYMYDIDARNLLEYHGEEASVVRFMHRSDLFHNEVVKTLESVNEFGFSVDKSRIYSGVNVGYDKQDYDSENRGRDEWNFENYYLTGVELTESKLDLKCPYRADCYGMEELVLKRNEEESTDSDEDVVIVKCLASTDNGKWKIDRSLTITGTYTDSVFNGAFSPIYMVEANRGYIASFCDALKLSMTRGCRDVMIGNDSVAKDFTFLASERLFKCGKIEVSTDDLDMSEDKDGLIEFVLNGCRYKGYLQSVEQMCQHDEALEYELIEHSVTCIS